MSVSPMEKNGTIFSETHSSGNNTFYLSFHFYHIQNVDKISTVFDSTYFLSASFGLLCDAVMEVLTHKPKPLYYAYS